MRIGQSWRLGERLPEGELLVGRQRHDLMLRRIELALEARKAGPQASRFLRRQARSRTELAKAVAAEWVVPNRLDHVLDKLGNPNDVSDTGKVIEAMVEDVMREGAGEIADTKAVRRAIGAAAAKLFKARVTAII